MADKFQTEEMEFTNLSTKEGNGKTTSMFPPGWANPNSLDNHCIAKLNELTKKNALADIDADEVITLLELIKDEYVAANIDVQSTLTKLHLLPADLPKSTQSHLQKALDVEEFDLKPRRFGPDTEKAHQALEEIKMKRLISSMKKKNAMIQKLIDRINAEYVLALDETNNRMKNGEQKQSHLHFCEKKEAEYKTKLAVISTKLRTGGISDTGLINSLINMQEEVKIKSKHIDDLAEELKQYEELPPDLTAAVSMLKKSEIELDQLNQELRKKIEENLGP